MPQQGYRPDMTLDVYRGRKTTTQQQHSRVTLAALVTAFYAQKRPFVKWTYILQDLRVSYRT